MSEETPKDDKPKDFDVSSLSPADQEFYRRYGRLPDSAALLKRREGNKKQFDSADYFMEAEKAKTEGSGSARPKKVPPHLRK
jgi:predicted acetyltransferase